MNLPAAKLPNSSVCPRCGVGFRCGNVAGDVECWCTQLPHIMPVPSATHQPLSLFLPAMTGKGIDPKLASCFCPACLQLITDDRKSLGSSLPPGEDGAKAHSD